MFPRIYTNSDIYIDGANTCFDTEMFECDKVRGVIMDDKITDIESQAAICRVFMGTSKNFKPS